MAIARANGQPTIAPAAKKIVADRVRLSSPTAEGWNAYAQAIAVMYIAKVDGKNAKKKIRPFKKFGIVLNTCRRVPHSSAKEHHEEVVAPNAIVDFLHYCPIEFGLGKDRDGSKKYADGKEGGTLLKRT